VKLLTARSSNIPIPTSLIYRLRKWGRGFGFVPSPNVLSQITYRLNVTVLEETILAMLQMFNVDMEGMKDAK
jgi:hypothetical protein